MKFSWANSNKRNGTGNTCVFRYVWKWLRQRRRGTGREKKKSCQMLEKLLNANTKRKKGSSWYIKLLFVCPKLREERGKIYYSAGWGRVCQKSFWMTGWRKNKKRMFARHQKKVSLHSHPCAFCVYLRLLSPSLWHNNKSFPIFFFATSLSCRRLTNF